VPIPIGRGPENPEFKKTKSHPAILSLTRTLRRYDLCSWSSHTLLHQSAILLGPSPPKLLRKHDKVWTTPPALHAHNSSIHSILPFSNTNPQPLPGPYTLSPPPLPVPSLLIYSVRCITAPLTRKECFSVTYVTPVGIWPASSPPSLPSLLGYGNVPCVPLLPPYPAVHCNTSASPLPSLTLTLTKHHLGDKKKIPHPLPAKHTTLNPPSYGGGADISGGMNARA